MEVNNRLNIVVAPTEVIWKLQQLYFIFPHYRQRCFLINLLKIQWQAAENNVAFNEMSFEQSVASSSYNGCLPRSNKMDFVGLIKSRWDGSFNKTDFFGENKLSKNNK